MDAMLVDRRLGAYGVMAALALLIAFSAVLNRVGDVASDAADAHDLAQQAQATGEDAMEAAEEAQTTADEALRTANGVQAYYPRY
jgi:hypothetical protein